MTQDTKQYVLLPPRGLSGAGTFTQAQRTFMLSAYSASNTASHEMAR